MPDERSRTPIDTPCYDHERRIEALERKSEAHERALLEESAWRANVAIPWIKSGQEWKDGDGDRDLPAIIQRHIEAKADHDLLVKVSARQDAMGDKVNQMSADLAGLVAESRTFKKFIITIAIAAILGAGATGWQAVQFYLRMPPATQPAQR